MKLSLYSNKVNQDSMRAQIVELTGCHIKTQLCSAEADQNK